MYNHILGQCLNIQISKDVSPVNLPSNQARQPALAQVGGLPEGAESPGPWPSKRFGVLMNSEGSTDKFMTTNGDEHRLTVNDMG